MNRINRSRSRMEEKRAVATKNRETRWKRPHKEQLILIMTRPGESKREKKRLEKLIAAGHVSYIETYSKKPKKKQDGLPN